MRRALSFLLIAILSLGLLSCHPPDKDGGNGVLSLSFSVASSQLLPFNICSCEDLDGAAGDNCDTKSLSSFAIKIPKMTISYTGSKIFNPEYFKVTFTGNNVGSNTSGNLDYVTYLTVTTTGKAFGDTGPIEMKSTGCGFRYGGIKLADDKRSANLVMTVKILGSETDSGGITTAVSTYTTVNLTYTPD